MLSLVVKLRDTVIKEFKTDQNEIIIGRDPASDIQIDNIAISREHARIVKGPNDYLIEDLNSKNGIFVDGKKITKKYLKADDEITVGKYSLQIVMDDDPSTRRKKKAKGIVTTYKMRSEDYQKILKN